jgi:predicted kinase
MPKLLMLKGLPASGKSTLAKEMVASGNYVRVNRDSLRQMLHNGKWSGKNEDVTVQTEIAMVEAALDAGKSVVVDDTNLNPKNEQMWKNIAHVYDATFEVKTLKTPLEECIRRDAERGYEGGRVGKDVIVGMALQWSLFPRPHIPGQGFVLCDLDGTLCEITHRLHYASGETKDWKKFFEGIPRDKLRHDTLQTILQASARGNKIFFVSARPEDYRGLTEAWLKDNLPKDFAYEALIMRRAGDTRQDTLVKQQMYDTYFKNYPIEFVIDDRPSVIEMWRSNGLEVVDVGNGEDF